MTTLPPALTASLLQLNVISGWFNSLWIGLCTVDCRDFFSWHLSKLTLADTVTIEQDMVWPHLLFTVQFNLPLCNEFIKLVLPEEVELLNQNLQQCAC